MGRSATNYDTIADVYHTVKGNPIKKYSEEYTVFKHLGDVSGKAILDLGCGDGYYAKLLVQAGAKSVLAVDSSCQMIERARQEQTDASQHVVTYQVGDATGGLRTLTLQQPFDLVLMVFVLQYSSDEDMLGSMFQTAINHLAPNGRLVAVTGNPNLTSDHLDSQQQYGADIRPTGYKDASVIHNKIYLGKEFSVEFDNFHWTQGTIERKAKAAGFEKVQWHDMDVSSQGIDEFGEQFWQPYKAFPAIVMLECTRSQ